MADCNLDSVRIELENRRGLIDNEVGRLLARIQEAALIGNDAQAGATLDALLRLGDVRRVIGDALGSLTGSGTSTPVYTVGSWFLSDCFRYLVEREVEALHHVTGVRFGNVFTLDKMVTFQMSAQTTIQAKGDIVSTHKAAIEMDSWGHKLHACFHSHPGKGPAATHPSSVDFDYQARLERGGYAAIGGIFSRDGHFRAFSLERPFQIVVYGKGVEKVDDKLFRLTEVQ